jgi:nicotinate-nucleotide adenylyltransferase
MTIVGVFGGSFDPPHVGHVLLAAYVTSAAPLDRLLVIPNYTHALAKNASASFEDRYAMCELAFSSLGRVEISDVERSLGSPSRTLRTLEELAIRLPGASFRLVVGADIAGETHLWHRWDRIVELAPPLYVRRTGHAATPESMPVAMPEVSSTDVRRRLAARQTVEGLVPSSVLEYIGERALYGATSA